MTRQSKTAKSRSGSGASPPPTAIVAVCTSAHSGGSLEALLRQLSGEARAAFVVVSKQDESPSLSSTIKLLERVSGLPTHLAADGMVLAAGHIYVAPAGQLTTVVEDRLRVEPAEGPPGERGSIDSFLVALAVQEKERAVGVILAGLGSDGVAGVTALKEHGGLTLSELDETYPGQGFSDPSGLVDFNLPVDDLPERISAYIAHLAEADPVRLHGGAGPTEAQIAKITTTLHNRTGHDFHGYKRNTFLRRIERRMQVVQIDQVEDYVTLLAASADEVHHLFQDLLIGVTQFFRDALEFEKLRRDVVPKLFEGKGPADQVRVWVLGCATGEEAYSLGILLREYAQGLSDPPQIQIFATDLDGRALSMARTGRYPETIAQHMSAQRLARWFNKEGTTYTVSQELRDLCIFSQHNVIKDAPFSRTDLVSCRNLLIYLNADVQTRVIPLFHFALRPGGYLFLGAAENVTRHPRLFAPIDRRHRIFVRLNSATRILPNFPLNTGGRRVASGAAMAPRSKELELAIGKRAERVAQRYTPAYVVIDHTYEILHFSGRTGAFLEPSAGQANLNLLNMVHRDLRLDVRAALQSASETLKPVVSQSLQLGVGEEARLVDVIVEPVEAADALITFVVLFRDAGRPEDNPVGDDGGASRFREGQVQQLEGELRQAKERLQATVEELEATNEELTSSNEEYQSINEELQSANEELETSKEELQSVNEELQTVNGELAQRVTELARANSDLKNLLESTQIATLFLDNDLRVKTFTPTVADIFHLIETDLGRPLAHITSKLNYPELQGDLDRVLRTLSTVEREVFAAEGDSRYLARLLPYRSTDNFIAGVVMTFLDISATARAQAAAMSAGRRTEEILESIADAFYALDADTRFTYANAHALSVWSKRPEDVLGRRLVEVFPGAASDSNFAPVITAMSDRQVTHVDASSVDGSWLSISIYPSSSGLSVYFRDISEKKQAEARQVLLSSELQHRARNTLAVVRSVAGRTLETSASLDDFSAHFEGRLGALGRTLSVVSRTTEDEVDLEDLVREELLAYAVDETRQLIIAGPPISLRRRSAEILGMALHELSMNAVKYGALAAAAGKVAVSWRVFIADGEPRLAVEWRETGVPAVDPMPSRRGFGRDLLERVLPSELQATTALEFCPGGVRCSMELPMPENGVERLETVDG